MATEIIGLSRAASGIALTVAMLAGCGQAQTVGTTGMLPQGAIATTQGRAHKASGSYGDLLYVTSTSGIALVSYPHWQIMATIPGTNNGQPCSDPNNGTVYVMQPYLGQIVVYAHGGTTPINTLSAPAPYDEVYTCSVDPTTGDLAAMVYDSSLRKGAIAIYPNGQGTPTIYKNGKINVFLYGDYDSIGNLYVVATGNSRIRIVKLSAKKKQFSFIQFQADIFLANFHWDGRYFASLDYNGKNLGSTLYQIQITGTIAQLVNTTTLYHTAEISNFCLDAGSLIGFFGRIKRDNNQALARWFYPSGGNQTSRFYGVAKGKGNQLLGVTLSVAPSGSHIRQ